MAAKKVKPKSSKAKKPAPAKPVGKKPVVARKAAAPVKAAKKPVPTVETPKARAVPKPVVKAPPLKPVLENAPEKSRTVKPAIVHEDNEAGDSALLAGPRNVQPYLVKRGEQYMNKVQLDQFRDIWRAEKGSHAEGDRTFRHEGRSANFRSDDAPRRKRNSARMHARPRTQVIRRSTKR